MKRRMNLQLFEDGAGAGSGNQGGNAGSGNGGQGSAGGASGAHAGTYTYEQLEEIASARVNKSEHAALANFFRSQGMTEAEVTEAITQFKNERAANQPDTANLKKCTVFPDNASKHCSWLSFYRPYSFASQPFDCFAISYAILLIRQSAAFHTKI